MMILCARAAAQTEVVEPSQAAPARPSIKFNRWQEDWSVLADSRIPREKFDEFKYISLSDNPKTYLSVGLNVRERFEDNHAVNFGVGGSHNQDYDISRVETHADLRIADQFQVFAQVQSDYAIGKSTLTPVDQDRLDLEQGFVAFSEPAAGGDLKVRLGRQQIGFDLQRFVSVRDGPNVRQSYDAAWVDYERGTWRFITFYSQPVQYRDLRPFDDNSNGRLTYGGFRVEHRTDNMGSIATYYSRYTQDGARYLTVRGDEQRNIGDVRWVGKARSFDWDIEAMNQTGRVANRDVEAWAMGSLVGYTVAIPWSPRFGLQADAASGNGKTQFHSLGTFNPLFPNGSYMTLAGYTGYVNIVHLKPSVTVHPSGGVEVLAALAVQWRESAGDAIYTQPNLPIAGTAGRANRYTGTYGQIRADWAATGHVSLSIELVHFAIGSVLRAVGGHDSDYVGAEVKYGW